jgi:hypothetical protein
LATRKEEEQGNMPTAIVYLFISLTKFICLQQQQCENHWKKDKRKFNESKDDGKVLIL